MSQLVIENLDPSVIEKLKVRAQQQVELWKPS
jgi:plasmid stability protein